MRRKEEKLPATIAPELQLVSDTPRITALCTHPAPHTQLAHTHFARFGARTTIHTNRNRGSRDWQPAAQPAMRSVAGSTAVATARPGAAAMAAGTTPGAAGGDGRQPHRHHPLQQEQTHDSKPSLHILQTHGQGQGQSQNQQQMQQQNQQLQQQQILDSDSGDGDDGDDRSDVDGDDDGGGGMRSGKRKRPISVSYVYSFAFPLPSLCFSCSIRSYFVSSSSFSLLPIQPCPSPSLSLISLGLLDRVCHFWILSAHPLPPSPVYHPPSSSAKCEPALKNTSRISGSYPP